MGLFGKKKAVETISDKSEEYVLKDELGTEVEDIQNEFRTKQKDLNDITHKIQTVKEEYSNTVSNLMQIKKEINQKKMELDVLQLEYRKVREKIKNTEQIAESVSEFNETKGSLSKIKQDLKGVTEEYDKIKEKVVQGQSTLHSIKKQQIEYEKELDEARSRLHNAKEELGKKDNFQDTGVLTPKEKEFTQKNGSKQKSSAGVIEAASVVVGSLKSKLNMTQKELEEIQLLLEKEREEHEKTKKELIKLKESTESLKKLLKKL
jgi:chromosome segregation protein